MASIDSRAECRSREIKTGKKRESIAAKICAAHAGARAESLTARNKTGPDRSLSLCCFRRFSIASITSPSLALFTTQPLAENEP